jgi:biotin carboxylase
VRVDTYGYAGYRTNPNFDSLLAKVIVHAASFEEALACAEESLALGRAANDGIGIARSLGRRAAMGRT